MKTASVISSVVDPGLCCGCGICVATCPHGNLAMGWNAIGELNPKASTLCPDSCTVCQSVCPYVADAETADSLAAPLFAAIPGMRRSRHLGYYLNCWAGYSKTSNQRANGASGGLLTWLLEELLRTGAVDGVLCVAPTPGQGHPLFQFVVCRTSEEVRRCSRSAYYPVEPGTLLREIMKMPDGRYAITALPCVCKALRRAQRRLPRFRERIAYVLGLACGKNNSCFHVEAICAATGGNPHHTEKAVFRVKSARHAVANFATRMVSRGPDGKEIDRTVHWHEPGGQGAWWGPRYFTPLACDLCDDMFAECADAVFMDAWLPEYKDWEGTNLVAVRHPGLRDVFERDAADSCQLRPIAARRVELSQRTALTSKRGGLPERARIAKRAGLLAASLRLEACKGFFRAGGRRLVRTQWALARASGRRWAECAGDFEKFRTAMRPWASAEAAAKRRCRSLRWLSLLLHPERWLETLCRIGRRPAPR
jgi:coenzyme F420-reducing hydrogenase beta subunit